MKDYFNGSDRRRAPGPYAIHSARSMRVESGIPVSSASCGAGQLHDDRLDAETRRVT